MSEDPLLRVIARIDLDQFDRDRASLLRDLARLESESVSIPVDVEGIRLAQRMINDLDGTTTLNATVNESELETAQDLANNLDGTTSLKVNVDESELDQATDTIGGWSSSPIALTFDIGQLPELISGALGSAIELSGIGGLLEMQVAEASLTAQVGGEIAGGTEMINDIFTQGWGESRQEIANLLALANQMGIPLEDMQSAVQDSLIIAAVHGQDANEVLRTMTGLVNNEMVDGFDAAADSINFGFQSGANRADDMLDSLNEYGSTFRDMGIGAEEALGLFNAGLDAGLDNTDRAADAIREFNIRAGEIGNEEVFTAYQNLNLEDSLALFQAGELDGITLLNEAVEALGGLDEQLANSTAIALFGTQLEDFSSETFIDALKNAGEANIEFEGSVDDAGSAISDTLPAAFDRAKRAVTTGIGEFLDEQFNITGILDDLTGDINTFFDSVQSGNSIQGSFRMAFDDNEIVDILLVIREVLSDGFFGLGMGLAEALDQIPLMSGDSVRDALADLSGGELMIDLAVASDGDSVSNAIRDAVDRGIDQADLMATLGEQLGIATEIGDVEQVLAIRDAIQQIMDIQSGDMVGQFLNPDVIDSITSSTEGMNITMFQSGPFADEAQADFNEMLDGIFAEYNVPNEFQDILSAQLRAMTLGEEIEGIEFAPEFLDSVNETAENMVANLETAMNEAMSAEDWAEALNLAGALSEATGEDYIEAVELLASEAGAAFTELSDLAEFDLPDASFGVSSEFDAIATDIGTTATSLSEVLSGAEMDLSAFRELSVTEFETTEQASDLAFKAIGDDVALAAAMVGGFNEGLLTLQNTMLTMPSMSLTGAGMTNYNQTVNNNQSVTMNNATAAAAQAGANSTAEIIGGNAPS